MRSGVPRLVPAFATALLLIASAPAGAAVTVVFGTSWDGPGQSLQAILDGIYGAGQIDVATDYLGAKPGDPDPWFWIDNQFTSLLVREVAGNADYNQVGWYEETGSLPVLANDGVHDGMVFDGPAGAGAATVVVFQNPMTRFGFYLDPNGPGDAVNAPQPEKFYTNRLLNDRGLDGSTALHAPWNGDVQALVFDISRFTKPNTWLVCWEDLDSGAVPGANGASQTDNDFQDLVMEVTALGATPARAMSFGALKARYAR